MQPIKKILVAIKDIDARSMPAVRKAAQLAKASQATLELFHALSDTVLVDALDARRLSLKDYEAQRLAKAMTRLEAIAKRIRAHDIEVTCAAEWDYPPAEAIVRRAMRTKADFIVAERHASKHVAKWMLAYTDWELLRQAPCPVLLVKLPRPYHRPVVLTAVDPFHENAKPTRLDDTLLRTSGQLTSVLRGSLRVIYCVAPATLMTANWAAAPIIIDSAQTSAALARARKALVVEVARHSLPSHRLSVIQGSPREAIPDAAKSEKASIVVMGAISRSGFKRLVIGNTAEAVLDALPCDILVIKPSRFQTKVPRRSRGAQLMAFPTTMTG